MQHVIRALLICVSFLASVAQAVELNLLVNGKAHHFENRLGVPYNENNWGAGLQYDFDSAPGSNWVPFLIASGFKDSNNNMSYFAGGGYLHRSKFTVGELPMHFDAGAVAFLMTRKNFKGGAPFPAILPVVSVGTDRVAVNISYVPQVEPKSSDLLFFHLKLNVGSF